VRRDDDGVHVPADFAATDFDLPPDDLEPREPRGCAPRPCS